MAQNKHWPTIKVDSKYKLCQNESCVKKSFTTIKVGENRKVIQNKNVRSKFNYAKTKIGKK